MKAGDEASPGYGATKSFLEHLEDLRSSILWCGGFIVGGIVVAAPLVPEILALLKQPLVKAGVDPESFLRIIEVTGGFSVAMRVMLWSSLLISLPGVVFSVAHFVFPGLTLRERRTVRHSLVFATMLFVVGVCMGYFMTLPVAIRMMLRINVWLGVDAEFVELSNYVAFVLKLLIAFGLAFELPVVVLALGSLGIVTSGQLRKKRRHVIIFLLVLSMFLTPQDPITMLLMAVPLTLLYELCIWLIWVREKRTRGDD